MLRHLGEYLAELEKAVESAGGVVHWARDAEEANEIVVGIVRDTGADPRVPQKRTVMGLTAIKRPARERCRRHRTADRNG